MQQQVTGAEPSREANPFERGYLRTRGLTVPLVFPRARASRVNAAARVDRENGCPVAAGQLCGSEPNDRVDPLLETALAAGAGDARAASILIVRLHTYTQRIVERVLGSGHPAVEDVTQEAAITLLTSLKSFRGECTVAHFANSVTLRVALSARRRMKKSERWLSTVEYCEGSPDDAALTTPLSVAIDKRSREVISRILGELPPWIAEVLTLSAVFGYTTLEVAEMLRVTEGTVRSYLRTGKKEFRRLLRRERRNGHLV